MARRKNIEDLREELFEAIKMLKEDEMDTAKGKVIADLSGRIIETAKIELDFMKHIESTKSEFLLDPETKEKVELEAKKLLPENRKYFSAEAA